MSLSALQLLFQLPRELKNINATRIRRLGMAVLKQTTQTLCFAATLYWNVHTYWERFKNIIVYKTCFVADVVFLNVEIGTTIRVKRRDRCSRYFSDFGLREYKIRIFSETNDIKLNWSARKSNKTFYLFPGTSNTIYFSLIRSYIFFHAPIGMYELKRKN